MSGNGFNGDINHENGSTNARANNLLPEPSTSQINSSYSSISTLSVKSDIHVSDLGMSSSNPIKSTCSEVDTESDCHVEGANYNKRNDMELTSNDNGKEETNHEASINKTNFIRNYKPTTSDCHTVATEVIDLTNDDSSDEAFEHSYDNTFVKTSRLNILRELLPDADITFLKQSVDSIFSDDDLQLFVSHALEYKDYPKNDIERTDNNLLPFNRQVEQSAIVNPLRAVDETVPLISYSVPHSANFNLPHTVTSTTVQETTTPQTFLRFANIPVVTYTQPFSFPSVLHTVFTNQQNRVQSHPSTDLGQRFIPMALQITFPSFIGHHSEIPFSGGGSTTLHKKINNGTIHALNFNLSQPKIVHQFKQALPSENSHENEAGISTGLPEANDENYHLLCDILFWVNRAVLKRDIKKLKCDDDVDMYLLRVFCEDGTELFGKPNRGPHPPSAFHTPPQKHNNSILLRLLPDACPTFLKKESINLLTYGEVYKFVMKLKQEGSYPKRKVSSVSKLKRKLNYLSRDESIEDVDLKYQILKEMLPDADPDYLLKESKVLTNDADIEAFVIKSIESKNYPKHDEFLKRQDFHKQWRKYIENFDIEHFLQLFPNPIRYFYIEKINSKTPLDTPVKFLSHRYKCKDSNIFLSKYQETKYSLTKTCDRLDKLFHYSARNYFKWDETTTFPTSVLQEIAFIQNKKEIAHYMLFKSQRKTEAYDKAKAAGLLQECGCCYDEKLPEDMSPCGGGHLFCMNCIKRGSEVVIGNGGCTFPCFSDGCNEEFSFETVKTVLNPEVFARMLCRKQYEEVNAADIPGLETCSFCEFCFIPAPEDKLFHCLNPLCLKITCRKCKKVDHLPLSCEEFLEKDTRLKMQSYVEDKMTDALVSHCCSLVADSFSPLRVVFPYIYYANFAPLDDKVASMVAFQETISRSNSQEGEKNSVSFPYNIPVSITHSEDTKTRLFHGRKGQLKGVRGCEMLTTCPSKLMAARPGHQGQALVSEKTVELRTCWKCGKKFVKESGCNMMTCNCGAKMCYVCRQPVQSYHHFVGGRCSQNMDTTAQDTATVMEVGKKAKEEAEAANPGFSLANDPTVLLKSKRRKH